MFFCFVSFLFIFTRSICHTSNDDQYWEKDFLLVWLSAREKKTYRPSFQRGDFFFFFFFSTHDPLRFSRFLFRLQVTLWWRRSNDYLFLLFHRCERGEKKGNDYIIVKRPCIYASLNPFLFKKKKRTFLSLSTERRERKRHNVLVIPCFTRQIDRLIMLMPMFVRLWYWPRHRDDDDDDDDDNERQSVTFNSRLQLHFCLSHSCSFFRSVHFYRWWWWWWSFHCRTDECLIFVSDIQSEQIDFLFSLFSSSLLIIAWRNQMT